MAAWTSGPGVRRMLTVHALQQYIQDELDDRGWIQADLSRASGLSTKHISKMMLAERLRQMPDPKTITALARAFVVGEDVIRGKALEAMGVSLAPVNVVRTVRDASNEELLAELARRLDGQAASRLRPVGAPTRGPVRPLKAAARPKEHKRPKGD